MTMEDFARKHAQLREDLLTQGDRVVAHAMNAVESFFSHDGDLAKQVVDADRVIDRADIDIERASIQLLLLSPESEHDIRSVFTIVKINNELERIADCGVNIAESSQSYEADRPKSGTFEVMANSVIGMVRDANKAMRSRDQELARRILDFDDTIDRFRTEVVRLVQTAVKDGTMPLENALELLNVNRSLERMADHCTNICEQLIYLETGKIVKHLASGWTQPESPEQDS
ncbi:MAG: phosphate transport system regulatory protein PhoU [Phycisphaerae bacterium]|nr:phosphate transport system regulatory protein PhoU [Phycisphaerae bacterium]